MQDARSRQTEKAKASRATLDRLGGRSRIALGQEQQYYEILPKVGSAARWGPAALQMRCTCCALLLRVGVR